jgi:hypothetical protein
MKLVRVSNQKIICQSDSFLMWMMIGICTALFGISLLLPHVAHLHILLACLQLNCQTHTALNFLGSVLAGFSLLAVGLILVLLVPRLRVTMDLDTNQIDIAKHWVLFNKTEQQIYGIADIYAVDIDTAKSSDGDTYRLMLIHKSGELIPLSYSYSGNKKQSYITARQIGRFLGVETGGNLAP